MNPTEQTKADTGKGNVTVGNTVPSSKRVHPTVECAAGSERPGGLTFDRKAPAKPERPRICGAMSQQRDQNSHQSAPQKFVRLVGCQSHG
jgi:hypothetical protein